MKEGIAGKCIFIFVSAFILNFFWEEAHSVLYIGYKGAPLTHGILLRAALFDAVVIALFSYPFLQFESLKRRRGLLYTLLMVFAIALEKWALLTGRWAYADMMPIIPLLRVGLTPAVQLGILGYLAAWVSNFFSETAHKYRE